LLGRLFHVLRGGVYFFEVCGCYVDRRRRENRGAKLRVVTGPFFSLLGKMIDLDLFFSISQGTLPWQPILCKNEAKLPTPLQLSLCQSKTEWDIATSWCKITYPLHLLLCHSETEWAIVLWMSALKAPLIALHCVKMVKIDSVVFELNRGRKWKLCCDSTEIGLYCQISQQLLNQSLPTFQH